MAPRRTCDRAQPTCPSASSGVCPRPWPYRSGNRSASHCLDRDGAASRRKQSANNHGGDRDRGIRCWPRQVAFQDGALAVGLRGAAGLGDAALWCAASLGLWLGHTGASGARNPCGSPGSQHRHASICRLRAFRSAWAAACTRQALARESPQPWEGLAGSVAVSTAWLNFGSWAGSRLEQPSWLCPQSWVCRAEGSDLGLYDWK